MKLTNEVAITIFLTEENVKKFIHFIFDNNLMKNADCKCMFNQFSRNYVCCMTPNNTFYAYVLYYLKLCISYASLRDTLYLFPDFLDCYAELTDVTNADLKNMYDEAEKYLATYQKKSKQRSKKVENVLQMITELAIAENVPLFVIANRVIPTLKERIKAKEDQLYISYDEFAHNDFLTEDNVKQFVINDIFETFEYDNLQQMFFRYIDVYYMNLKHYENTMYWYFCEHLKTKHVRDIHTTLSCSPTYNIFIAKHVLERKTLFMGFCDEVFANYDFTSNAHNVFANDYLARLVCQYV